MKSTMEKARESLGVKGEALNRKEVRKRVNMRVRHGVGGMYSRVRSGIRTGRTLHFELWMADLKVKSALQRTTLASLVDREEDLAVATAYGLLFVGGYKNVFDLTQADKRDLLHLTGIGPKRLALVKANLAKHQVAVNW